MNLRLISLLGLISFVGLAWAISANRKAFPWRTVVWGIGLQLTFALLILKTSWGGVLFAFVGAAIQQLIRFSTEGTKFVFGPLGDENAMTGAFPGNPMVFALLVTGTIIIVSCLSSVLYHWGVLQKVVRAIAWVMRRMNSMLLGHHGASGRTPCMYLSIARRVAGSSQERGRCTMRDGTVSVSIGGS